LQANTTTYKYWDQQFSAGPFLGKFDVLLRGCYLYKDLPFLRVTFIDVEKSRRVVSDGVVHEDDVTAKRTELLRSEVNSTTQPRLLTAYVTQPVSSSTAAAAAAAAVVVVVVVVIVVVVVVVVFVVITSVDVIAIFLHFDFKSEMTKFEVKRYKKYFRL